MASSIASLPVLIGPTPANQPALCLGPREATARLSAFLQAASPEADVGPEPTRFMLRFQEEESLWVGALVNSRDALGQQGLLALCAPVSWATVRGNPAAVPLLCASFLARIEAPLSKLAQDENADPLRVLQAIGEPQTDSAAWGAARHQLTEIQLGASARDFFSRTLGSDDPKSACLAVAALKAATASAARAQQPATLACPAPTAADSLFWLDLLSRNLASSEDFSGAFFHAAADAPLYIALGAPPSSLPLPAAADKAGPAITPLLGDPTEATQQLAASLGPILAPLLAAESSVRDVLRALGSGAARGR